jgi:hypothetical protein
MNDLTIYQKYRDQLKTGDALLYRGHSIVDWLILKFSKDWNHAGLVVRLDEYKGQECRVWTVEATSPAVTLVLLSKKLAEYDGEVWWFPLLDKFDDRRGKVGEFALAQAGTKYDFKSLIKNILGRVTVSMRALFCSELDFLAWRDAGIVSGDIAPRPGDIPGLGIFKEPVRLV